MRRLASLLPRHPKLDVGSIIRSVASLARSLRQWIPDPVRDDGGWRIALLLPLLLLTACGLRPLYSGGSAGPAAQMLSSVTVGPIDGKAGWLIRNAIIDRIGDGGSGARYRLDIKLDDRIQGLGLRANATTTRERRSLRARYQLVDAANGKTVIDATAGSDIGIDVVNSEYATIAAEQTALERLAEIVTDQIVTNIALQAKTGTP